MGNSGQHNLHYLTLKSEKTVESPQGLSGKFTTGGPSGNHTFLGTSLGQICPENQHFYTVCTISIDLDPTVTPPWPHQDLLTRLHPPCLATLSTHDRMALPIGNHDILLHYLTLSSWPHHDHSSREVLGNWKHYNISAETLNYRNQRAKSPLMTRELNRLEDRRGSWTRSRLLSFRQKFDSWLLHSFFLKRKPNLY